MGSIRSPIFDGRNFVYWRIRTIAYLQSLGTNVWEIVEGGYTFPTAIPADTTGKKQYETNATAVNTLLGSMSQSEFVKVMQLKSTKEIWEKIVLSYEGDSQVRRAKLQTLIIQYETLKMNSDEDETEQDYKLLMAYGNDDFLDALEEDFLEEITKIKNLFGRKEYDHRHVDTSTY